MSNKPETVVLCGVGGQGTILAADLLAKYALEIYDDVKVSEIHGMAQRGGSVTTVVRYGENVNSMIADPGTADIIVSFETTEALRNAHFLKPNGFLIVNNRSIKPLTVLAGNAEMPENPLNTLHEMGAQIINATDLAEEAGEWRSSNVVLIGALAKAMNHNSEVWRKVIANRVPERSIEANLKAFELGQAAYELL